MNDQSACSQGHHVFGDATVTFTAPLDLALRGRQYYLSARQEEYGPYTYAPDRHLHITDQYIEARNYQPRDDQAIDISLRCQHCDLVFTWTKLIPGMLTLYLTADSVMTFTAGTADTTVSAPPIRVQYELPRE